jgi:hypothetical protein
MTLQQATGILKASDSTRIFCASKKVWTDRDRVEYDIAMIPGALGPDCSMHSGSTLEEAVELALTALDKSALIGRNEE